MRISDWSSDVCSSDLGRRGSQSPEGAMAVVGLGGYEDALARQLSAGQKKLLSLARLWLSPAPLWLLDEPYANLDLGGIELVNRMVQAHLRAAGAAPVPTHRAYDRKSVAHGTRVSSRVEL